MAGWISAIASLAGTVASGVGSALANREEKAQIERERGAANHWYNQQIYADPTKRADYAAMMNQMKLALKKKNEIEDNKRTILGGTNESALAMQQQNAGAVANVAEQQMADQAKRVDMLNQQKRAEEIDYNKRQSELRARQFETWGNLAANAAQSFSGFDGKEGGTTGLAESQQARAAGNNAADAVYKDAVGGGGIKANVTGVVKRADIIPEDGDMPGNIWG